MTQPYLEITFRRGRLFAAYLHLRASPRGASTRTRTFEPGLVVDLNDAGEALGVEITAPAKVTVTMLNRALRAVGARTVRRADIAPLSAA